MKPWDMARRFGPASSSEIDPGAGGDPEAAVWTNRGSNTVSISGSNITLNALTSGSGFTAANAYSQPIDFSGFGVGDVVAAEFDRVYSGAWWDDNFINASFVTCLWLRKAGSEVLLDSGMWNYERVSSANDVGVKIEWRRTYDLPPRATIITNGGNVVFSDLMAEVAAGSISEDDACHIRIELSWETSNSMVLNVYIDGVHRYSASGINANVPLQVATSGCFFVHAHTYSYDSTVAVNNASIFAPPP